MKEEKYIITRTRARTYIFVRPTFHMVFHFWKWYNLLMKYPSRNKRRKTQKSIVSKSPCCYICGSPNTEIHHIFGRSIRPMSEKYGLTVNLCSMHHRHKKKGVHGKNHRLDFKLKCIAQHEFEKVYSKELFLRIFGEDYLRS